VIVEEGVSLGAGVSELVPDSEILDERVRD